MKWTARLSYAGLILLLALLTASCAKQIDKGSSADSVSIGPYTEFSGRLIVIEPKRRWQVTVNWKAATPQQGWLRLTHASTGRVVEFRWLQNDMEVRDNKSGYWKQINQQQLSNQGIVLPPQMLASVLLAEMPAHFIEKKPSVWESNASGSLIRLEWSAEKQRLIMTDMLHGHRATLIIQPS